MVKFNIFEDIEGVEFPAGRRGRVMYSSRRGDSDTSS